MDHQISNRQKLAKQTRFFSIVSTERQERGIRLMIKSLRAFGGELSSAPVWLFYWDGYRADPNEVMAEYEGIDGIRLLPLALDDTLGNYLFGAKVSACAQAEELAGPVVEQIVWFAADCLVINPPKFFDLGAEYDAAFRTVHHRNIGLLASEPLDAFWKAVYTAVGLEDTTRTIKSFVGGEDIRPYFNSHIFAIDPRLGLMKRWLTMFHKLVLDKDFQSNACGDQLHQIFLHQAILSVLLTAELPWERIRQLPAEYSYPLHFHERVDKSERPVSLNELVCIAYEDLNLHPDAVENIQVEEPLRSFLAHNITT